MPDRLGKGPFPMKLRIASLTILCLMLAVAPAMADTLYDNGPYNGTTDAWTINFGFSVSDSEDDKHKNEITGLDFVYWDASSTDVLTTVDMSIGSTSFGGAPQTLTGVTNTFLGTNQYGYALYQADYAFGQLRLAKGLSYVTLGNACTMSGCSVNTPIYWDENSGVGCGGDDGHGGGCPSTAYENTLGSIPSEAFTFIGTSGTPPEPSSLVLFGSGILGLAGVLRRRLNI